MNGGTGIALAPGSYQIRTNGWSLALGENGRFLPHKSIKHLTLTIGAASRQSAAQFTLLT